MRNLSKFIKLTSVVYNHVFFYPIPININFLWAVGPAIGIFFVFQIFTGFVLSMYYIPSYAAFESVEYIMRSVNNGWLFRYMHSNGVSVIFILLYLHIIRGLYFKLYKYPGYYAWVTGMFIYLLTMITAFSGYILPWGQMSFWAATVITNLFSSIPIIGKYIALWLWGGYSVCDATLNRFFSIHFLIPFLCLGLILLHLSVVHERGSQNPLGIESSFDKISFYPYYVFVDVLFLSICIFFFFTLVFFYPNLLGHNLNYIKANPFVTPLQIVPEWYFLPFYAILKGIPNKLGGVLIMGLSIVIFILFPKLDVSNIRSPYFLIIHRTVVGFFIANFLFLGHLGSLPAEQPYIHISLICTILYFSYLLIIIPFASYLENYLAKGF